MCIGVTEHCHFAGMVREGPDEKEVEEENETGMCFNCETLRALRHYCKECEDSGMIYESYGDKDVKPAIERTLCEGEVLEPGICGECCGPCFVNELCTRAECMTFGVYCEPLGT